MASEQVVVAVSIFAVGFLWYSNELRKSGLALWSNAFMIFSFLFMTTAFTFGAELFRVDGLYDSEDLILNGLMTLIIWLMWAITFGWVCSFILNFVESFGKPHLEGTESVGKNRFGPQ